MVNCNECVQTAICNRGTAVECPDFRQWEPNSPWMFSGQPVPPLNDDSYWTHLCAQHDDEYANREHPVFDGAPEHVYSDEEIAYYDSLLPHNLTHCP